MVDAAIDAMADASLPASDATVANDVGLPACEPALELTASSTSVRSFDLIRVSPSGGTGLWTFELIANPSNGTINPETGVYLAGDVDGVTDVVEMRDSAKWHRNVGVECRTADGCETSDARSFAGGDLHIRGERRERGVSFRIDRGK